MSGDEDTEAFQIFKEYVVSVRARPDTTSAVGGQVRTDPTSFILTSPALRPALFPFPSFSRPRL